MQFSRRDIMKIGLGATAACVAGSNLLADTALPEKKIPIGVQLYSVRDNCAKDFPGTIEAVAKMGYQGVEFAGYYGRKAEEVRKMLDQNQLKCCGTHTGLNTLSGKELKGTIEFNRIIGNKFLIVPSLPGKNTASKQALLDTAKQLTEIAEQLKEHGMFVGYHNHPGDFRKVDGQTQWDILFSNSSPEVVMQLDVGHCLHGGDDAVAIINKFRGRVKTIHCKEYSPKNSKAVIGEGDVQWKKIFKACETVGGTEWYVVEQEGYATTPMESIKLCLDNLRKMEK